MSASRTDDLRLLDLDGLRGWASLSVVFFHIIWETFGEIVPGLRIPFTGGPCDGPLAVALFFVLSGEALSVAYWKAENPLSVLHMAVKRYPRLTIPTFFSCFIVYCLMSAGLVFTQQASPIVHRPDWLGILLPFPADFWHLMRYSLFNIYVHPTVEDSYNPFLWTMRVELAGSFGVFCFLLMTRFFKWQLLAMAVVAVGLTLIPSLTACFVFGMIFARWHVQGFFVKLRKSHWSTPISIVVIVSMLYIGYLLLLERNISGPRPIIIIATAIVFSVHSSARITEFLRNNISQYLGKISFPLYLVHFPVIISLTSGSIVWCQAHGGLTAGRIAVIICASIGTSIAASMAFRPVEILTHRVCQLIGGILPRRAGKPASAMAEAVEGAQP